MLVPPEHSHEGIAVPQEAHRQEVGPLVLSHEIGQMPVGQPHPVPFPVFTVLIGGKDYRLDGVNHVAGIVQDPSNATFLEVVRIPGEFGYIPPAVERLLHQADPKATLFRGIPEGIQGDCGSSRWAGRGFGSAGCLLGQLPVGATSRKKKKAQDGKEGNGPHGMEPFRWGR